MNDAAVSMILKALSNPSGGPDLSATASELMARRGAADPRMALLLPLLAGGAKPASAVPPDDGPVPILPAASTDSLAQAVERERRELRRRNTLLASALGACELCWGEDGGCPSCSGKGRPGSSTPESELFDRFVQPAVLRRAAAGTGAGGGAPPTEGD